MLRGHRSRPSHRRAHRTRAERPRARLDPWLGEPRWKQGQGRATFLYRFESETQPVTPLKLKVEINTREHLCVLGLRRMRYQPDSPWHAGATDVLTYELEELLGTKLRALYQRKKGGTCSISRRRLPASAVSTRRR